MDLVDLKKKRTTIVSNLTKHINRLKVAIDEDNSNVINNLKLEIENYYQEYKINFDYLISLTGGSEDIHEHSAKQEKRYTYTMRMINNYENGYNISNLSSVSWENCSSIEGSSYSIKSEALKKKSLTLLKLRQADESHKLEVENLKTQLMIKHKEQKILLQHELEQAELEIKLNESEIDVFPDNLLCSTGIPSNNYNKQNSNKFDIIEDTHISNKNDLIYRPQYISTNISTNPFMAVGDCTSKENLKPDKVAKIKNSKQTYGNSYFEKDKAIGNNSNCNLSNEYFNINYNREDTPNSYLKNTYYTNNPFMAVGDDIKDMKNKDYEQNIFCQKRNNEADYKNDNSIVMNLARLCESINLNSNLPTPEIIKFTGNPIDYPKFCNRLKISIIETSMSEPQKMTRLLQFVDGRAKQAIINLEGVDGCFQNALDILKARFGEPYLVVEASINEIINLEIIKSGDSDYYQIFADKINAIFIMLRSMNYLHEVTTDHLKTIVSKLPYNDQSKWCEKVSFLRPSKPEFNDLVFFIMQRAKAVNDPTFKISNSYNKSLSSKAENYSITKKPNLPNRTYSSNVNSIQYPNIICECCGKNHRLWRCYLFAAWDVLKRKNLVTAKKLCFYCLGNNHSTESCLSKLNCQFEGCQGRHHTLLHDKSETVQINSCENISTMFGSALQIIPIQIYGDNGIILKTNALLDTGSEMSFISSTMANDLGISGNYLDIVLSTMNGQKSITGKHVTFKISAVGENSEVMNVPDAIVVDNLNIKNSSSRSNLSQWQHLSDIWFPDIKNTDVTVLIGVNTPNAFVPQEVRAGLENEPIGIKTMLGWSIFGPLQKTNLNFQTNYYASSFNNHDSDMNAKLDQLFNFDIYDKPTSDNAMSVEDKLVLDKLQKITYHDSKNYVVPMLWNNSISNRCVTNKETVLHRLYYLKKRFIKDEILYKKYKNIIDDYIAKGYAKCISEEDCFDNNAGWYLPHHPVVNEKKPEKLRVVFDAASKYNNYSLNDMLLQGPDMMNSIVGVLCRFRVDRVAITADIESMFHQVKVPKEDSEYLRFYWFSNGLDKPPVLHKMLVHIFGAKSSPSCAMYALRRTAEDNINYFGADVIETITNNFYVDDLLKSVENEDVAINLSDQLIKILQKGGFKLTKWLSNSRDVIKELEKQENISTIVEHNFSKLPTERTLGMLWDAEKDVFKFKVELPEKPNTKRGILSTAGALFDPLGFICPATLTPKLIIQELWKNGIDWDQEIPDNLLSKWVKWKEDIQVMNYLEYPRCIKSATIFATIIDCQLHVFSDASEIGYGVVVYLRIQYDDYHNNVSLIFAKSKTSPIKQISIPRLELQAATLSSRIGNKLQCELNINIDSINYWSDSMTTLGYIRNKTKRFHTFVANRVGEIHQNTNIEQWRFCPGNLNPADDASRGLNPKKLTIQSRWWNGPAFLREDPSNWPEEVALDKFNENDPEIKENILSNFTITNSTDPTLYLINYSSSWVKLIRIVSWFHRFFSYIKDSNSVDNLITPNDLYTAERMILKYVQSKYFQAEINSLKVNNKLQKNSNILKLSPFIHDDLLLVGGRIEKADLPYYQKHQILLPSNCHLSTLIIRYYHEKFGHASVETTISSIQEKFWIINCRSNVKNYTSKCITCKRFNSQPKIQIMGDLPSSRILAFNPPFTNVGLDYFGPMIVSVGRKNFKRWGCIFICFSTKAVHIEICPSLNTDDFINTLRQFMCRRGCVKEIWSDNGTNFVGAVKELKDALHTWKYDNIGQKIEKDGILWKFNPPGASHMGGIWERQIRSIRKCLLIISGNRSLDDHRLRTFLIEAEHLLNSRPLTPASDDPNDLLPLTPNHFLFGKTTSNNVNIKFTNTDLKCRKHWIQVQALTEHFWKRWIQEYLPTLQCRKKWDSTSKGVEIGDLVLICDYNVGRSCWPLARIVEILPDENGFTRMVRVKTSNGILFRPIHKLCFLSDH